MQEAFVVIMDFRRGSCLQCELHPIIPRVIRDVLPHGRCRISLTRDGKLDVSLSGTKVSLTADSDALPIVSGDEDLLIWLRTDRESARRVVEASKFRRRSTV